MIRTRQVGAINDIILRLDHRGHTVEGWGGRGGIAILRKLRQRHFLARDGILAIRIRSALHSAVAAECGDFEANLVPVPVKLSVESGHRPQVLGIAGRAVIRKDFHFCVEEVLPPDAERGGGGGWRCQVKTTETIDRDTETEKETERVGAGAVGAQARARTT